MNLFIGHSFGDQLVQCRSYAVNQHGSNIICKSQVIEMVRLEGFEPPTN